MGSGNDQAVRQMRLGLIIGTRSVHLALKFLRPGGHGDSRLEIQLIKNGGDYERKSGRGYDSKRFD